MIGEYYNIDCMELMARYPDKHFDLAIVDPPYGNFNNLIERTGGSWSKKYQTNNSIKFWDIAPNDLYFDELFRVSINQIIWGGNYFKLPISNNFIIWEKLSISESFTMAMAEYAWTSIKGNAKIFKHIPQRKNGIHPTQKPVALYKWLLLNYAKPGQLILDTHVGSGSSLIACEDMEFKYVGCELDTDYYNLSMDRLTKHLAQGKLFT